MYQWTLTSVSHTNHTTIHASLWRVEDNGRRVPLMVEHRVIPAVQGGLFEETPAEFLDVVLANVAGMREKYGILTSNNDESDSLDGGWGGAPGD